MNFSVSFDFFKDKMVLLVYSATFFRVEPFNVVYKWIQERNSKIYPECMIIRRLENRPINKNIINSISKNYSIGFFNKILIFLIFTTRYIK